MVWFIVHDGFSTSPKVLAIPRAERLAAVGLWTLAGAWSAQHLTDGEIPEYMLDEWAAPELAAANLVDVGLWRSTSKGWRFHAWAEYQQSKDDVEQKRAYERDKKRKQRRGPDGTYTGRAGQSTTGPDDVPGDSPGTPQLETPPVPRESHQPNQALPSQAKRDGTASRGTRIPTGFELTEGMREYAKTKAPAVNVEAETEDFVAYWTTKTGAAAVKTNWETVWQTWIRRAQKWAEERGWSPSGFDGRMPPELEGLLNR
jgi:hypothetical protein